MAQTLHERPVPHDDEPASKSTKEKKSRWSLKQKLAAVAGIVGLGGAGVAVAASTLGGEKGSPNPGTSLSGQPNGEPVHYDDSDGDRDNDGELDYTHDHNNNGQTDEKDDWDGTQFVEAGTADGQAAADAEALASATEQERNDLATIEAAFPGIADADPRWDVKFVEQDERVQQYIMDRIGDKAEFENPTDWEVVILLGLDMTAEELEQAASEA